MRKWAVAVVLGSFVLVSCAGAGDPGPGQGGDAEPSPSQPPQGSPEPYVDPIDEREIGIYATAIRALADTEPYERLLVHDRACRARSQSGDGGGDGGLAEITRDCEEPFTQAERDALLEKLDGLPVRWVEDPQPEIDRIFEGEGAGGARTFDGVIQFSVPDGDGDRVEVVGSAYCGGLCGHWMTLVIERKPGGWRATGTTGPVAIS